MKGFEKIFQKEYMRERLSPAFATSCRIAVNYGPITGVKKRKENYLIVYQAFIINAKDEKVIRNEVVVGRDETDAATSLRLTDDELALKKKDYLEILWNEIGDFESRRAKAIRIEKDED